MRDKLLTSFVFLVMCCILTTQTGLTQYPLNDLQMRKTARLKLEYIHLDSMNMTLTQALMHCDSVRSSQQTVIVFLDDLIIVNQEQLINQKEQIQVQREKYALAYGMVKKEKKLKWIFVGTTGFALALLALSLL